ncbi:hypothetical protein N5094_02505 [Shewanella putrefaciens]|jgi:hypothetical protein|uniref:hypothetical protein n=1 Tax=Shewanella TaxID=22 RepID=UPI000E028F47|nr:MULTISPECIES: hypothetical protein [Shewanella]CAD6364365.1 hypothetical protein SHEWT2_02058 [Shewanella hafniensis]MCA1898342.1 hypothetical protein [Shewanella putrefaciens]MCK7631480.1 hypothetical protein [Shewanella sp. JNE9-1]MCK7634760.1 hypothetical protein [Shewanella sp. JNE17]MCK7646784.1 hypothetical protein [Shewanella sp. JNE3-1]
MSGKNLKALIISDDVIRNGIGVEFYIDDKLIVEIFRDDNEHTKMLSVFEQPVSLELIEECVTLFKELVPIY